MNKRMTQRPRDMRSAQPQDTFDDGAAEAIASLDALVSDPLDIAAAAEVQVEPEPATQYLQRGAVPAPEEAPTTYVQRAPRATAPEEAPTTYVQRAPRATAPEEAPTTYVQRAARPSAADATVQAPPTRRMASAQQGAARGGTLHRDGAAGATVYSPGSTQVQVPPTTARPQVARQGDRAPIYAVPSQPYDDPYVEDYERSRNGRRRPARRTGSRRTTVAGVLLRLVALVPRLAAIALCALVVVGSVPFVAHRGVIVDLLNMADGLMPDRLVGLFVLQTPFGGAFRGDMAIMAFVLFLIDWALVRISVLFER